MTRGAKKGTCFLSLGIFLLSIMTVFPGNLPAQTLERGNLVGTIVDRDGRTPIAGAVLRLRNISSGAIYESPATDTMGRFRVDGLSKGIYTYGITTPLGEFNSNELIGILANETTKISISLNPYESNVQSAVQEVLRAQAASPANESEIGRVVRYDPNSKRAEVFIERGLLQVRDQVRIFGPATNFSQDVENLFLGPERARRLLAGETGWLPTARPVQTGDIIAVGCKKGVVPFFLTPCGIAWVVAGSGAILAGIIEITDKTPVSPSVPETKGVIR